VIYLDAAYIGKCYLNEPGAERVQDMARKAEGLTSCEIARLEFFSLIHRHRREGNITAREGREVLKDFEKDEVDGVWQWLPVTPQLVRRTCDAMRNLPAKVLLRAGDALHLGCARENGFKEVYTNDRRMLASAPLFGLEGIDVTR
jgi:predicted nucleic acid-binding protein